LSNDINNIQMRHPALLKKARPTRPGNDRNYIPDEEKQFARQLEQQYVEYLVKKMQENTGQTINTTGGRHYQDLLNTERAKMLTQSNGGLGIQDMVLDQIYPKKFRNPESLNAYLQHRNGKKINRKTIEMHGPKNVDQKMRIHKAEGPVIQKKENSDE
jgi:Rod binding domain-containing protein